MTQHPLSTTPRSSTLNRRILSLSLPLAGTQLATIALSTTDTLVMGHLGVAAVAGGGLAVVWFNQIRTMAVGILTPLSNRIAEAHASMEAATAPSTRANHAATIRDLSRVGLFLATVLAIFSGIVLIGVGLLLPHLGQPDTVVAAARPTMLALAPGFLPYLWFQVARQFTVGLSAPQALLWITLASIVVNLVLDLIAVFGCGPIPPTGVWGVGLSTTLVHVFTAGLFFRIISRSSVFTGLFAWNFGRASRASITHQLRLGAPVSLTYGAEAGMFSVLAMVMGALGPTALAAHNVAYQITFIVFQFGVGFSHGASVVVSRFHSTADPRSARSAGIRAMGMVGAVVLFVGLIFLTAGPALVAPFLTTSSEDVRALAVSLLVIGALMELVDTGQNVGIGALRGLGDTTTGLAASIIGYWFVGLPTALVLAFPFNAGPPGVWWGLTAGLSVACVIVWSRFLGRTTGAASPAA